MLDSIPSNLSLKNIGNINQDPANIWGQISNQWSQIVTDIGKDTDDLDLETRDALESKIRGEIQSLLQQWKGMSAANRDAFTKKTSTLINGYTWNQTFSSPGDLYDRVSWTLNELLGEAGPASEYLIVNELVTSVTDMWGTHSTDFNTLFSNVLELLKM